MIARADVTACILAGGRARRMAGAPKPRLEIDGVAILDRQRVVLAGCAQRTLLSVASPGALGPTGLPEVVDPIADAGPLAGIVAALAMIDTPWLLAVAGDMPDLQPAVLALLCAAADDQVDAVAARVDGWPEPLCALWHRRAHPVLAARLAAGQPKVAAALAAVPVAWLPEASIRAVDPELRCFRNINRPSDLPGR
ncbi:MAG: molybdenum cofactor guanylyltransferase [Kofleriaceae bacterium]